MRKMTCVFVLASMFAVAPLFAATYYVSPTGTNSAAGTEADPYNLDEAIAAPQENLWVYSGGIGRSPRA